MRKINIRKKETIFQSRYIVDRKKWIYHESKKKCSCFVFKKIYILQMKEIKKGKLI